MTDPVPIAIAVVEYDGRFLVGRRPPGVPLGGLWEFPGGKIAPGETGPAAAERECLEETGLAVKCGGCLLDHIHRYDHGSVRLRFYGCRLLHTGLDPHEPFQWVGREMLGELEFPAGNRLLIQQLRADL